MNNIGKYMKAFSLSELMVVMFILTIVLAVSMPIVNKKPKVKPVPVVATTPNLITCMTVVNSTIPPTQLTHDISSLSYIVFGGGGGGGSGWPYSLQCSGGGGGGSSAILVGTTSGGSEFASVIANGGTGGLNDAVGTNGDVKVGTISTLTTNHYLTIYVGGGGGRGNSDSDGFGGGGGAGYYGGGGGVSTTTGNAADCQYAGAATGGSNTGGVGGTWNSSLQGASGAFLQGGEAINPNYPSCTIHGGAATLGGLVDSSTCADMYSLNFGSGGGGYGASGGEGWNENGLNSPPKGGSFGMGRRGNPAAPGDGGSVKLIYTTATANGCFLDDLIP